MISRIYTNDCSLRSGIGSIYFDSIFLSSVRVFDSIFSMKEYCSRCLANFFLRNTRLWFQPFILRLSDILDNFKKIYFYFYLFWIRMLTLKYGCCRKPFILNAIWSSKFNFGIPSCCCYQRWYTANIVHLTLSVAIDQLLRTISTRFVNSVMII